MGKIWILLFILRLIGLYEDAFLSLWVYEWGEWGVEWTNLLPAALWHGWPDPQTCMLRRFCRSVFRILRSIFLDLHTMFLFIFHSVLSVFIFLQCGGWLPVSPPIPISIMVPLQSLSFSSKFSFFTFTFSKTKSFHFVSSSQSLALLALCDR